MTVIWKWPDTFSERKSIGGQQTEFWLTEKDDMKFVARIRFLTAHSY